MVKWRSQFRVGQPTSARWGKCPTLPHPELNPSHACPDLKTGHVDHLLFLSVFLIFLELFMLISKLYFYKIIKYIFYKPMRLTNFFTKFLSNSLKHVFF